MAHTEAVLSVKGLYKSRSAGQGEAYVLRVPRLEARLGDKILLTGPSGAGKSTLLDMLGMVLKPDGVEQMTFCPTARAPVFDVAKAWESGDTERLALWRRSVGYVLQTGGLLPFLTVRENIAVQRRLAELPASGSEVDSLTDELKIGHLLNKQPAALSVGERQRVAIARALAARPLLVLADEPTAALDPENAATVLGMFSRAVAGLGAALVLVTHAPEQMRAMRFTRYHVRTARQADGVLAVLQPVQTESPMAHSGAKAAAAPAFAAHAGGFEHNEA